MGDEGDERMQKGEAEPSRGGAVGQDTLLGLTATRCPPWPTQGCQGPQKSGRVGKSLQNRQLSPSPAWMGAWS